MVARFSAISAALALRRVPAGRDVDAWSAVFTVLLLESA